MIPAIPIMMYTNAFGMDNLTSISSDIASLSCLAS